MKVLRIKLRQNKAHYRKADSVINRLTYPLPPYSTVIGALHNACGYKEYHQMDISIQGKYGSMGRELYVNHCKLRRLEDDRGILIKLNNPGILSTGYKEVASAMKGTGNSFMKEKTIHVTNRKLLEEYKSLKNEMDALRLESREEVKPKVKYLKDEIKDLKKELRELKEEKSDKYEEVEQKILEFEIQVKKINDDFKSRELEVKSELEKFATLTKSPQLYEVLYDVELVIHVNAEKNILDEILDNINNLVSLGRSEDYIDLLEAKFVELNNTVSEEKALDSTNTDTAYISKKAYLSEEVLFENISERTKLDILVNGTKYFLDKDYEIIDSKRVFNKKEVVYVSNYSLDFIFGDSYEYMNIDEDNYIVEMI